MIASAMTPTRYPFSDVSRLRLVDAVPCRVVKSFHQRFHQRWVWVNGVPPNETYGMISQR